MTIHESNLRPPENGGIGLGGILSTDHGTYEAVIRTQQGREVLGEGTAEEASAMFMAARASL